MNINKGLIDNFVTLQNYFKTTGDKGRTIAYGKAISALRTVDFQITDPSQVKGMRGIGPKVLAKIKEYIDTGQIQAVEEKKEEIKQVAVKSKEEQTILEFANIWGVGPVKAKELYGKGMRSITDIRKNKNLLTNQQKIGLKYYEDLNKKVPRESITTLYTIFIYYLNKEYGRGTYKIEVAGSYRRGAEESGDIDCLISSNKFGLNNVVSLLTEKGVITDTLSMRNEKFMGIAHCPSGGQHIRLDIEFVPEEKYGTALLYFTGSKGWNVYMRGIAKKKGFLLNEHGIFYISSGKKVKDYPTEEDIFEILGMKYTPPERR